MSESESASESVQVKSVPRAPKLIRRLTQASQSAVGQVAKVRRVGRLSVWLPFAIATLGTFLVIYNAGFIIGERLGGPTAEIPATIQFPAMTTTTLMPGGLSWTSAPVGLSGVNHNLSITPANLNVDLTSLDVAARTISVRLSLSFSNSMVRHLWFTDSPKSAGMPLLAAPRNKWADLLVSIQPTSCLVNFGTAENCGTPVATIPLGDLVASGGFTAATSGSSVPETVTLPVSGWPNRFPSDVYDLDMNDPGIASLPDSVVLITNNTIFAGVPTTVTIGADPGLADHTVTISEYSSTNGPVIDLHIGRPGLYQTTVYIVALLPLLLGIVVWHIWFNRKQPSFDLGFIAGLIAAMLAILPLRAVLVPTDLDTVGLTLVDDILLLGVLLIAVLMFFQYARIIAVRPRPTPPKSDADSD
jgi:hypothetical protein